MRTLASRFSRLLLVGLMLAIYGLSLPALAAEKINPKSSDQTKSDDISGSLTQSYTAGAGVQTGMIVALDSKDSKKVVPLKPDQVEKMLGIVIGPNDAPLTLTPEKIVDQQVLVATSGRNEAIVSNQNGAIKVGDYITISGVSGVGMRADQNHTQIIGKAAANFSGSAGVIGTVKLKDSIGKEAPVALGRIPIDIEISHNPLFVQAADYVPGFLAKAANTIAQKPVSVARIYLSMGILLVAAVLTANLLYSGVKSGMQAVGRNPLSKKSIVKSLIQTVIAGLIVFVAGVFAVYLLLKL